MFVTIVYKEGEMLVNPNCYIKLIYEYIRVKVNIPDEVEIDLCDENGVQKNIYEPPAYRCGLEILEKRCTYYLLTIEVDVKGRMKILPHLQMANIMYNTLIRKLATSKVILKSTMFKSLHIKSSETVGKKKTTKFHKTSLSHNFPGFIDESQRNRFKYDLRKIKQSNQANKRKGAYIN